MTDTPTRAEVEALTAKIVRDVAELPDRTSPPDEPMLLLVTERELIDIVQHRLDEAYAATLAPQAALEGWEPISTAPTDGSYAWVHADAREGLSAMECFCAYHPEAGWCVDELREVTRWHPKISAALNEIARRAALEADARVAEMREALHRYGAHHRSCAALNEWKERPCDCGFDALLNPSGGRFMALRRNPDAKDDPMTSPTPKDVERVAQNIETKRQISYEEAHQIAQRFIDEFFHNPGRDRPRIGIPARPEYDDDICLHSFIDQQRITVSRLRAEVAKIGEPQDH